MGLKLYKGPDDEQPQVISGPMCPITPAPSSGKVSQGGAVTSAFLSAFL